MQTTNINVLFALKQYNLALSRHWALNKALSFASEELKTEDDINDFQNLLIEQSIKETKTDTLEISFIYF